MCSSDLRPNTGQLMQFDNRRAFPQASQQLDVTCCVRLQTLLHVVAFCWELLRKGWTGQTFSHLQTDATTHNIAGPTCWELLRPFAQSFKAQIDLFGILINQGLFFSKIDVNKEKGISVLAGVPYPTPRALFALLACPESPSPFLSKACHAVV